jgi:DNA-binding transcriptional ArsR family regulator
MQEVQLIENAEKAGELLKPIRIKILSLLHEPRTCPEIARNLGLTTQKINYHVNVLHQAGLIQLVEERRNRGTLEGVYQAVAKSYWFSPRLVKKLGGKAESRDRASLAYLLRLAEELQVEIGHLADRPESGSTPSLALDAQIRLKNSKDRASFMEELQDSFKSIANKYGARKNDAESDGNSFRLILACYPRSQKTK